MSDEKQSVWRQNERPWWAPDAQGFVVCAILALAGVSLFYRMTHPTDVSDKQLETMLTILYGTALVSIINFLFGSSRGSQNKDESQSKIVEKLIPPAPPNGEPK